MITEPQQPTSPEIKPARGISAYDYIMSAWNDLACAEWWRIRGIKLSARIHCDAAIENVKLATPLASAEERDTLLTICQRVSEFLEVLK